MQYLLYAIAFYLLILLLPYLIAYLQFRKFILQYPKYEIRSANSLPVHLTELFQKPIKDLEPFGFEPCSYLLVEQMQKLDPPTTWELLLYNKCFKTYAKVTIRLPVESVDLFDIEFYTVFEDNDLLLTMNGKAYRVLGEPPNLIIQDAYTDELSVQWQLHQERLQLFTTNKTPRSLTPEAFTLALQKAIENYLDRLLKLKQISPVKEFNLFQYNRLTALKKARQTVGGANKAAVIAKKRRERAKIDASLSVEIPIELEVEEFQRMDRLQQGLLSKKLRTWLLLGSFGWFVASYGKLFSPETLIIFIAALLLHEGGHVLAMKLFGYRDTSILFLPFLGAIATARQKEDATLAQKVWISLAGPLPGLILGVGLAIATRDGNYPDSMQSAGWILIMLNLFNLLPVYPLDGGQVADLLLFSRFPYLGVLFKVVGVICLGLLGINSPMILAFTLLIALSIPSSFRTAKVHAKLRQELRHNPPTDRENLLHSIFGHLKQLGYGNLPYTQKSVLVKELIQRHHESRADWKTRVFLSALYLGSLFGGVAGTFGAISPHWIGLLSSYFESPQQTRDRITQERQQEIDRATEALRRNPNDVDAYLKRAQMYTWLGKDREALADYDRAVSLKPDDISSRLNRASFRAKLEDSQGAIEDYDYVLRLEPHNIQTYYSRAQLRNEIGDYRRAFDDYNTIIQFHPKNSWAYVKRGYVRQQLGDYKGALVDANRAIALEPELPDAYALRSEVRRRLGDKKGALADEKKADALYETSKY